MREAFSTRRPQIQNWRQRESSLYGSYINNRTRPSSNVASSAKVKTMQSSTRAIIYPQSSPITCNNDMVIEEFTKECEIQHNVVHLRRSSKTEPLIWRCWNFSDQVTSSKSSANSLWENTVCFKTTTRVLHFHWALNYNFVLILLADGPIGQCADILAGQLVL